MADADAREGFRASSSEYVTFFEVIERAEISPSRRDGFGIRLSG